MPWPPGQGSRARRWPLRARSSSSGSALRRPPDSSPRSSPWPGPAVPASRGCRDAPVSVGRSRPGALAGLLPWGRPLTDPEARAQVAAAWGIDADTLPAVAGLDLASVVEALAADRAEALEAADSDSDETPERRIGAVLVAGVDAADTPDPQAFLAALADAPFVLALETRHTEVTALADVVLPVAVITEKPGTLVDWEGRARPFGQVIRDSTAITDARALSLLARAMGRPLGSIEVGDLRAELAGMGRWQGPRPEAQLADEPEPGQSPAPVGSPSPAGGTCSTRACSSVTSPHWPAPRARPGPGLDRHGGRSRARRRAARHRGLGVRLDHPPAGRHRDGRRRGLGARELARQHRERDPEGRAGSSRGAQRRRCPVIVSSVVAATEFAPFGQDPWWLVILKVLGLFLGVVILVLLTIWGERRVVARMNMRVGPNRVGPFGVLQGLMDGIKLALKEDIMPTAADKAVFFIAPIISCVPAFMALAVIPFGPEVSIFGVTTPLQLTDFPVAVLYILAISSIGIYGIVFAGWSSGSTYPSAGLPALLCPDDLLRDRDGPVVRRGVPLRRVDVHLGDRLGAAADLVRADPPALVHHLRHRDGRRQIAPAPA